MADKFDKKSIFNVFKNKATAKGFDLNPDTSNMAQNIPTMNDLLEAIAEGISEVIMTDETKTGTITGSTLKLGPTGVQQPAAYKSGQVKADIVTDPTFFAWMETLHALLQGVYPEPGNGSPNVFATAMKLLLTQKPTSITAKIANGSTKVKITT